MSSLLAMLPIAASLVLGPTAGAWDVGAHLVQGFAGAHPRDKGVEDLRRRAEAGELGGVIFFSYNVEGPEQLRELTHYIASWAVPEPSRPLLLMVDQEGGHVQRLPRSRGFHGWPEPRTLGEMAASRAKATFAAMAEELADVGLNVNLAPVVDLGDHASGLIGGRGRSFGASPALVAERAGWQVEAQRAAGVASVLKHFPGHGLSRGDTHAGAVDATRSWRKRELEPFARLIREGRADALMSSHLVHRTLEPSGVPLTFSRALMHTVLRGQLGFAGVLVTDDLGMGAVSHTFAAEEAVVGALGSSHDLLLFGLNEAAKGHGHEVHRPFPELHGKAEQAVQAALAGGTLTPQLLAQSDARLRAFRHKLNFPKPPRRAAAP